MEALIFQTKIIWSNIIQSLKYLRPTTPGCKDIGIKRLAFVAKTQLFHVMEYFWQRKEATDRQYTE